MTTQCMLISEVLGIPLDHIAYIKTDTDAAMSDLGAYASEHLHQRPRGSENSPNHA